MQLVIDSHGHALAIGSYHHVQDNDNSSLALVGLFNGVFIDALYRNAGSAGITIIGCLRPISLRRIALPG